MKLDKDKKFYLILLIGIVALSGFLMVENDLYIKKQIVYVPIIKNTQGTDIPAGWKTSTFDHTTVTEYSGYAPFTVTLSYPPDWTAYGDGASFELYPPTRSPIGETMKKIELLAERNDSPLESMLTFTNFREIQTLGENRWAVGEDTEMAKGSPEFVTMAKGNSMFITVYNISDYGGIYRDIIKTIKFR